ncbi:BQ2448_3914 [Microbotryum intermedium]|uniref:BQ2448_3914 protein n=1 Tax=Microbotryum intermedium TaxID=269621 RepID=A0A238FGL7_9BASI|nr:BQ2448_3914 [Microbotryum intermedium]
MCCSSAAWKREVVPDHKVRVRPFLVDRRWRCLTLVVEGTAPRDERAPIRGAVRYAALLRGARHASRRWIRCILCLVHSMTRSVQRVELCYYCNAATRRRRSTSARSPRRAQLRQFDFIDVHEFHSESCTTRLQYGWLWLLFIKSIAVYAADIYTAIALLASGRWSGSILQSEAAASSSKGSSVLEVPFSIGKWIFTGCIIFSLLLLAWEARKSRAIIKSRDISYAFTNVMSQSWYALRSYDHFCFFCQIDNSKKKKDEFAFFVFFTFKGWKRLVLADGPRQVINGITLYSFGKSEKWTTDLSVYFGGGFLKTGIIITMLFTVIIFVGSAVLLLIAAIMYVPLLCYIQGNLKEYCCHKVDKRYFCTFASLEYSHWRMTDKRDARFRRIAELMKRKNRKRLAREAEIARKEARGDFSHLKARTMAFAQMLGATNASADKKTGKLVGAPLPQPTLPKVGLRDNDLYAPSYSNSEVGSGVGNYRYPPPSNMSSHNDAGGYFDDHRYDLNHPLPKSKSNNYASSEADSFDLHAPSGLYSQSVSSMEAFAQRGEAMGYNSNPSRVRMGGEEMSRAPSYRSRQEEEEGKATTQTHQFYADYYQAPAMPSPQHGSPRAHPSEDSGGNSEIIFDGRNETSRGIALGRGDSARSEARAEYVAPSRQRLYDRTAARYPSDDDSVILAYAASPRDVR